MFDKVWVKAMQTIFIVSIKSIKFVYLFHSLEDLDWGQCRHHPSTQIKIKYASFNQWMEHEKQKHCFTTMHDRDYIGSACPDINREWKLRGFLKKMTLMSYLQICVMAGFQHQFKAGKVNSFWKRIIQK